MSVVVKLLNGDLITCLEKEVDANHLSGILSVHPLKVHIAKMDENNHYYHYLVTVTPNICITLKREWLSGFTLSFLTYCKNESILEEYKSVGDPWILANPHPMIVDNNDYPLSGFDVEMMAQNPNDRVLTAMLRRESPLLMRGLVHNPNPRAISYLIDRFQHWLQNWEEVIEYGFDLLENELFCDWNQMFSLATLPEHIAFIFGLYKRSNVVYKLIYFCPEPLAQELLFHELENGSLSVDWFVQRYSRSSHPEIIKRILEALAQTGQLVPRQLFMNNSDTVVKFLLSLPECISVRLGGQYQRQGSAILLAAS